MTTTTAPLDFARPPQNLEEAAALLTAALRQNVYMGPHMGSLNLPQQAFILAPQREVLFGGQSKGGKTDGVLIRALKFIDFPYYQCLILDRSFPNLTRGDGLIPRLRDWTEYMVHSSVRPKWDDENHASIFPGGAKITCGFIERPEDQGRYKRANYQQILWEELTEHPPGPESPTTPPAHYLYLFSRLSRPAGSPIPLFVGATTNPDGPGHAWVKVRWGLGHDSTGARMPSPPPTRLFIPANYKENPGVDHRGIEESMSETSAITQAQLLGGDWDVEASGDLFMPERIRVLSPGQVDALRRNIGVSAWIRYWDKAATEGGGDFTVGALMAKVSRDLYGVGYVLAHIRRGQWSAGKRNMIIRQTAGIYRPGEPTWVADADPVGTIVYLEQEPGSGGLESVQLSIAELAPTIAYADKVTGDKITRARPYSAQMENWNIGMVQGPWNSEYIAELTPAPNGIMWDQIDASDGAFNKLALIQTAGFPLSAPGQMRQLAPGMRW